MIKVAQRTFREFNKIEEDADQSFCNSIFVELEMCDRGWFIERLKYDMGEGIYVQLPEKQELIIIVYRGEITLYVNLKYDNSDLVDSYGLSHCPNHEFEYQGFKIVKDIEQIIHQVNELMEMV